MIGILDYGAGNLKSVQNTFDEIGAAYSLVKDEAGIRSCSKIVLPGVGHFGQMMRALDAMDVRGPLKASMEAGKPFLGICLGLQALFERSAEAPEAEGLGVFPGAVERFSRDARVPHMGWNTLQGKPDSALLRGLPPNPYVYFAHSYFVPVCAETSAFTEYTKPYTSVLEHKNIAGVQFHPEKSGPVGLAIVRNFATSAC